MRYLLCLLLLAQGCALTKEKVGDYVTEAALASVEHKIDQELAKRDLSIAETKALADKNQDGKVTKGEVMTLAKDMAKDLVDVKLSAWEAQNNAKLAEAQQRLVDRFTAEGKERREEQKKELEEKLSAVVQAKEKERAQFEEKVRQGTATVEDLKKYEADVRKQAEDIAKAQAELRKHDDFKQDAWDYFKALFGAIALYLIKQVWGARKHGETKAAIAEQKKEMEAQKERLEFLEKLTQKDLNQNGHIGAPPPAPDPAA